MSGKLIYLSYQADAGQNQQGIHKKKRFGQKPTAAERSGYGGAARCREHNKIYDQFDGRRYILPVVSNQRNDAKSEAKAAEKQQCLLGKTRRFCGLRVAYLLFAVK